MKNTHGRVLILVNLQALACNFTKINILHGCFSRVLNCTNDTKPRNASQLYMFGEAYDTPIVRAVKLNIKIIFTGVITIFKWRGVFGSLTYIILPFSDRLIVQNRKSLTLKRLGGRGGQIDPSPLVVFREMYLLKGG